MNKNVFQHRNQIFLLRMMKFASPFFFKLFKKSLKIKLHLCLKLTLLFLFIVIPKIDLKKYTFFFVIKAHLQLFNIHKKKFKSIKMRKKVPI